MPGREAFLHPDMTAGYVPTGNFGLWGYRHFFNSPAFTPFFVHPMLTDPRVIFGLWLIRGPILSKSRFFIETDNDQIREFIKTNFTRFWRYHALTALKSLEWGWSCSEVSYFEKDGQIEFGNLKGLRSLDTRALTIKSNIVGARITTLPRRLFAPKLLWSIQGRDHSPFYGRSRLFGAFLPWLELWDHGGYRDSRKLFFHKYAYQGGMMRHPPGITKIHETGETVTNKDHAREILEKVRTGGVITLPNTGFETGAYAWDFTPMTVADAPSSLMEYGNDLRDEIWEGMGIPPEVVRAEGTGAFAGRRIPMEAFMATLQEIVQWTIYDFDTQVLRPLIAHNFGKGMEYEIIPFGLLTPSKEMEKQQGLGATPEPGQPEEETAMSLSFDIPSEIFVDSLPGRGPSPLSRCLDAEAEIDRLQKLMANIRSGAA